MADIKLIVDSSDLVVADKRVNQLDKSVSDMGATSSNATKGVNSVSRGVNQFGEVAQNGGKKLNVFNMQLQQGGYQLQDFVVQIQSGTSFFTAFGQQASQFAGVLGPQGAVAGAIIAIGSAVGGLAYSMLSGANSVSTMEQALTQLNTALKDTKELSELTNKNFDDLNSKFGPVTSGVLSLSQAMQNIGMRELSASAEELTRQLVSLYSGSGWSNTSRAEDMANAFRLGQKATDLLVASAKELQDAVTLDDQVAAVIQLRKVFEEAAGPVGQMTQRQYEYYTYLVDAEAALRETLKRASELSAAIEDGSTEQERMTAWAQAALDKYGKMRTVAAQVGNALSDAADEAQRLAGARLEQMKFEFSAGGQAQTKYGSRGELTPAQKALIDANTDKPDKNVGSRVTQIKQTTLAIEAETEANKKLGYTMNTVSSNITNAFMSMVDGSNTVVGAFRNMMFNILKSVYEQSVAQPIANSLSSALFAGFSGSGPQTGSLGLPSFKFADGGVVGSPTTFQMSGGKTGLMGEAGPEAIMPLKRGSNGQLGVQVNGNAGGMTVQNIITVTGSDAAAVRMEVAKMIPQITNATKAAIIDAKKRGGQMGAAFA